MREGLAFGRTLMLAIPRPPPGDAKPSMAASRSRALISSKCDAELGTEYWKTATGSCCDLFPVTPVTFPAAVSVKNHAQRRAELASRDQTKLLLPHGRTLRGRLILPFVSNRDLPARSIHQVQSRSNRPARLSSTLERAVVVSIDGARSQKVWQARQCLCHVVRAAVTICCCVAASGAAFGKLPCYGYPETPTDRQAAAAPTESEALDSDPSSAARDALRPAAQITRSHRSVVRSPHPACVLHTPRSAAARDCATVACFGGAAARTTVAKKTKPIRRLILLCQS